MIMSRNNARSWLVAATLLVLLAGIPARTQESLPDLAKLIRPSVVTVIATGNKKGVRKTGSGFFVASRPASLNHSIEDVTSFARRLKGKYEEYKAVADEEVVRRILERTPEYRNRVRFPYPVQELAPKVVRVNGVGNGSLIITNWHVVANSKSVSIRTLDQQNYRVTNIVAYSVEGDLALLQTNAPPEGYQSLEVAKAFPEPGERVLVVGNPFGLFEGSLSDGIISSLRVIPRVGTVLQITAPVSPGNSGGPVVNMSGQVVGVVTFGLNQGQNLNFAMPWFTLARLLSADDPFGLFQE
jgi:S1-C subfamily serine protease